MSVLNQVILGVLLMVTLIVIALMVRVYSRTGAKEPNEINVVQGRATDEDEDSVK
jgi:hypothetical protein